MAHHSTSTTTVTHSAVVIDTLGEGVAKTGRRRRARSQDPDDSATRHQCCCGLMHITNGATAVALTLVFMSILLLFYESPAYLARWSPHYLVHVGEGFSWFLLPNVILMLTTAMLVILGLCAKSTAITWTALWCMICCLLYCFGVFLFYDTLLYIVDVNGVRAKYAAALNDGDSAVSKTTAMVWFWLHRLATAGYQCWYLLFINVMHRASMYYKDERQKNRPDHRHTVLERTTIKRVSVTKTPAQTKRTPLTPHATKHVNRRDKKQKQTKVHETNTKQSEAIDQVAPSESIPSIAPPDEDSTSSTTV